MDLIGLINDISAAAVSIDFGRKSFAVRGKERAGRVAYENGIARALSTFKQALASADLHTIISAEYTFLLEELHLCDKRDKNSLVSLTAAVENFEDAFFCLEIVENYEFYQMVEKSYLHRSKYRVKGFPKDAFHLACSGHRTRLKNMLSATGIDLIEKSLLEQRRSNMGAAQSGYVKKQSRALAAVLGSSLSDYVSVN